MLCIMFGFITIWAPSSEFVSSSIPSWHILTAHAQPFRGARDLAFCLKVPLDSLLLWASSEGSSETARMRRLAWTFAARIGDKFQIRLTRSIYCSCIELATYLSTSRRDSVGWCLMLCLYSGSPGINWWNSFAPKIRCWSCCWFFTFASSQSWSWFIRFLWWCTHEKEVVHADRVT